MEETLLRLEYAFEESLSVFLEREGTDNETEAYRHFLATFEALKTFETQMDEMRLAIPA